MLNQNSSLDLTNIDDFLINENNNDDKFPTVGLKSLLQNSELLELLLKPLSSLKDEDSNYIRNNTGSNLFTNESDSKTKSFFDFESTFDFFDLKANKINSDGDNSSKIYGNALLGSNIWDKNDAFQGEKFGPKFEYLEIDEFLNENGLNESDVEFLDQLQKTDATNHTENNKTNSAQLSSLLTLSTSLSSANSISSSSSTTSPSSSNSSSSNALDSSRSSSSNVNLNQTSAIVQSSTQQQNSFLNNSQVRNNTNSIIRPLEQQQPLSFSNITKSLPNKAKETNLNENLISSTSSTGSPRASTNSRLNSFDWSVNDDADADADDLDDIDDLEEYANRTRKYTAEELKLQPSLKKSKKNNMISMNDYSCVSVNNYSSQFSNDMLLSDSELSLTDFEDTEVSSSQHSTSKGNRKHQFVPNELKDDKYWARRRKNNMAAKRSRDARRMKENQIAITASYLERENDSLRKQLEDSKRETKLLKAKLARYESMIPMDGSK